METRYYGVPKLQPGPCVVCGLTDYPLSLGGPQICPACDCGIAPTDSRHPLRLQAALEAIDDHGRAGSFVETLKAKDKLITELTDALQSLLRFSSPNWPAVVELINRAREAR